MPAVAKEAYVFGIASDIINIPGGLGSDLDPSNRGEGVQCRLGAF
jgi:hypothetical protein